MKSTNQQKDWKKRHRFINKGRVKKAIKEFKNEKAPGPDGITPNIMKHLPSSILNRLIFIMKSTIDVSYAPALWWTDGSISKHGVGMGALITVQDKPPFRLKGKLSNHETVLNAEILAIREAGDKLAALKPKSQVITCHFWQQKWTQ
jgi:hypothetical protein